MEPAPKPRPAAPHALVLGGSGMLAGVCLRLARDGWLVSVAARRRGPIDDLVARIDRPPIGGAGPARGSIHAVPVDYHDDAALDGALRSAMHDRGPFALVVAWVHSSAPRALGIAARLAGAAPADAVGTPTPLLEIISSGATEPERRPVEPAVRNAPGILHRRVALGWIREGRRSRWLTDDEIAAGVIRAIGTSDTLSIVGVCSPIEEAPYYA